MNHPRREFLKKSFLGISGGAFIPGTLGTALHGEQPERPVLPYRILGRTGIKTPLISMGVGAANNPNFVRSGYDAGIKLFFSATYYGEGNNERLVGEGLKGLPRDTFIVGTAAPPDGFDGRAGEFTRDFSPDAYMKKAEGSLSRFGLDYVDIFMFPTVCKRENVMYEPMLKVLQDIKKQGKTRFLGIATHDRCPEALIAAADARIYDVIMVAYNYKVLNKEDLHKAMKYAADAGLGIVAMKTTAGAFRDKTGTSPLNTNAALKWVLQNENVSSIVSGMSSIQEMEKNLDMINDIEMTDQERKDLTLSGLDSEPGLYCHQCRRCVPQCRYRLEIPTAMRSYMYAYGYRDLQHARHTLMEAALPDNSCGNCSSCEVKCTAGFNIKERLEDISRLKYVPQEFLAS